MHPRQQTLGVRHISLKLLDDLGELVPSLSILIDLGFEVFKYLGINHARHPVLFTEGGGEAVAQEWPRERANEKVDIRC